MKPKSTFERLHSAKKGRVRPEKTADDAVIADLPSDTLRWIKRRRKPTTDHKVVLSHHRERQLREIFKGIDINKNGVLDLRELESAIKYVQEKLKHTSCIESLGNIRQVFREMDDNGDGTVDFHEFTNAMAGSSKSTLELASEAEIERLYRTFMEYGSMKHRKFAIEKLNNYTGKIVERDGVKVKLPVESSETEIDLSSRDINIYGHLKSLFTISCDDETADLAMNRIEGNPNMTVFTEKSSVHTKYLKSFAAECKARTERTLDRFILANKLNKEAQLSDPKKEKEYEEIHHKLSNMRRDLLELQQHDQEFVATQLRIYEEKKYAQQIKPKLEFVNDSFVSHEKLQKFQKYVEPNSLIPSKFAKSRDKVIIERIAKQDAYNALRTGEFSRNVSPVQQKNDSAEKYDIRPYSAFSPLTRGFGVSPNQRTINSKHGMLLANSSNPDLLKSEEKNNSMRGRLRPATAMALSKEGRAKNLSFKSNFEDHSNDKNRKNSIEARPATSRSNLLKRVSLPTTQQINRNRRSVYMKGKPKRPITSGATTGALISAADLTHSLDSSLNKDSLSLSYSAITNSMSDNYEGIVKTSLLKPVVTTKKMIK